MDKRWQNIPVARYRVGDKVRTWYGVGTVVFVSFFPWHGVRYEVYVPRSRRFDPVVSVSVGALTEKELRPVHAR